MIVNYSNTGVETVTACDSYVWHDVTYTASNTTATFTETNAANCDSVVMNESLNKKVYLPSVLVHANFGSVPLLS